METYSTSNIQLNCFPKLVALETFLALINYRSGTEI